MSLIAAILLTLGWALNVAAISTCRFVTVTGELDQADPIFYAMGLYTVEGSDGYCYVVNLNEWTDNLPFWADQRMNSARVCGGVAAFIGFVIMIMAWFIPCCGGCGRCFRVTIGSFAVVCCALAGCMFLVNSSRICTNRRECSFSQGGGLTIGAMLSYLIAACLFCFASDPEPEDTFLPPVQNNAAKDAVTTERTEQADGTVIVTTTTTHPDGSKTVETTTESPVVDIEADTANSKASAEVAVADKEPDSVDLEAKAY